MNEIIERLNQMNKNTLMETLGIEYTEFTGDSLTGKMKVSPKVHQPYGLLHGGATAVIAETLGSFLSAMQYPDLSKGAVGTNLNVYHLQSIKQGWLTATASFLRKGNSLHVVKIDVFNEQKEQLAYAILTNKIIDTKRI